MQCNSCDGSGSVNTTPCHTCKGQGIAYKTRSESINIPAGVNSGQNLRIAGKGNIGENGG